MMDWEKLKVADLKEELKLRGIPLTGLKLKQQLIDKLNEVDSEASHNNATIGEEGDDDQNAPDAEVVKGNEAEADEDREEDKNENEAEDRVLQDTQDLPNRLDDASSPDTASHLADGTSQVEAPEREGNSSTPADQATGTERVERLPDDLPAELKKEESHARDGDTPPPVESETKVEENAVKKDDPFVFQPPPTAVQPEDIEANSREPTDITREAQLEKTELVVQNQNANEDRFDDGRSTTDAAVSTRVPTPEILDDRRKRKRRSATPVPDSDDVAHKRARANNSTPITTKRESDALKGIQAATDEAQAIRDLDTSGDADMKTISDSEDQHATVRKESINEPSSETDIPLPEEKAQAQSRSVSPLDADRTVPPALHPATKSLYVRNFKRPLHIPTLRNHISSIAGPSTEDPVKVFYLDNIRTHAYLSFSSVVAASRVRNAIHGTRFPDEPMREELWADFIPDQKVQSWIDEETGSTSGGFGGGRGPSKKYEVVYKSCDEGVEATLQETSSSGPQPSRPGLEQSRSNRIVPRDSTASAAIASGVHPSRAPLVVSPATPSRLRQTPQQQPSNRPSDPGRGFRALDELFSSTNAKPKLYYKLPLQKVIDERLELIRKLRVNHDQMGQSGDEGMKRYSFEKDKRGHLEDWVDKGPEFGFGRRGQERLTGFGGGYVGSRGRGIPRGGRRGGDSWRGR